MGQLAWRLAKWQCHQAMLIRYCSKPHGQVAILLLLKEASHLEPYSMLEGAAIWDGKLPGQEEQLCTVAVAVQV